MAAHGGSAAVGDAGDRVWYVLVVLRRAATRSLALLPAARAPRAADSDLLERFEDAVNDHTLFIGWHDYVLAVGTLPIEAQIFRIWYFALYPEKLNPEVDTTEHQKVFPMLRSKSRADQKRALHQVISSFRGNAEVMDHPKTDLRQLMLRA